PVRPHSGRADLGRYWGSRLPASCCELVDRTDRIWSIRRPRRPGAFGAEAGATFPASGGPQARGPGAASLRSSGCAPPKATLSLAPAAWDAGLTSLRPAPAPAVTVH